MLSFRISGSHQSAGIQRLQKSVVASRIDQVVEKGKLHLILAIGRLHAQWTQQCGSTTMMLAADLQKRQGVAAPPPASP